jgi:hypothetical protein
VVGDAEIASSMLARLEDLHAERSKLSVGKVRSIVARNVKAGTGTLANIRKQRRKTIPASLMAAIRKELVEVLQAEIRGMEHEIATLKQVGADPDAIGAAASSLHATRALIKAAMR